MTYHLGDLSTARNNTKYGQNECQENIASETGIVHQNGRKQSFSYLWKAQTNMSF
jgi:hypothetical protein